MLVCGCGSNDAGVGVVRMLVCVCLRLSTQRSTTRICGNIMHQQPFVFCILGVFFFDVFRPFGCFLKKIQWANLGAC